MLERALRASVGARLAPKRAYTRECRRAMSRPRAAPTRVSVGARLARDYRRAIVIIALAAAPLTSLAEPLASPGDMRLRHDLQLLNDTGVINIPLTAWPIALGDIHNALADANTSDISASTKAAYVRVRNHLSWELDSDTVRYRIGLSAAENSRVIRAFEYTPREEGEVSAGLNWLGERFAVNLAATYVSDPFDGDEIRPDGTYIGVALGNWMLMAGWQERWWGPGRDGSMILSTNARPLPSVGIQRISSVPFETKWLSWMGPWTLTSFMGLFDDEREINNGLFWGLRGSFRPTRGLEIGLSRTAQWCGDDRPCDLQTFLRLLNGNDNRGANVDPEDEPGNQLAGIDIRWTLPRQIPLALYMQWIAEDTQRTGFTFHQWLRQVGVEYWGTIGDVSHRMHFEVADSASRLGAVGQGSQSPNVAYNHGIFKTGYRYKGRSLGHSGDGDTLSYSIGSTLVQSAGHSWNISLRYMEINRIGAPDSRHTLTPTPQELTDLQISHERHTKYGRFYVGLGYNRLKDEVSGTSTSDVAGFIQWSSN